MKSLRFFLLGLAVGLVVMGALMRRQYRTEISAQQIAIGDQSGLPVMEPGEFRVRLSDGFVSAKMSVDEHAAISNVVSRLKVWRDRPPPPSMTTKSFRIGQ